MSTIIKPYKIYRNLRNKCFSVLKYNKEKKGYRLCAHIDRAILTDVTTKVSEVGRQKVLKEKQKNVHAFMLAKYYVPVPGDRHIVYSEEIYYNPYKQNTFTENKNGTTFTGCEFALLQDSKAYIISK
jgi:hypothetical protein